MHKTAFILALSLLSSFATAESVPTIQSKFKPGELIGKCRAALADAQRKYDAIVAIPVEERNIVNTLIAADGIRAESRDATSPLTTMSKVHPNEVVREEADACETLVNEFENAVDTRLDLYEATTSKSTPRNPIEKRLLDDTIAAGVESGMSIKDAVKREEFRKLLDEKSNLQQQFDNNLRDDKTTVPFAKEELAGVPESYVAKLERDKQGRYLTKSGDSDFRNMLLFASNDETRRRYLTAINKLGGERNIELMQRTLAIRMRLAKMAGFENWADLKTAARMAKSAKNVQTFLDEIYSRTKDAYLVEKAALLEAKRQDVPDAKSVEAWDRAYYSEKLRQKAFKIDRNKLREYFPAPTVIPGLLSIYSELLGVDFREVKNAEVWAPDVKLIEVRDKAEGRQLGAFYMDLYQRDGKNKQGAYMTSYLHGEPHQPGGPKAPRLAAIVANIEPGANGVPPLLSHDEIETLFHEFGHVVADMLTNVPFITSSNFRWDFVEAPSQMLENWIWEPEVLRRLSGHYQDPTKKVPEELIQRLIESRNFMKARGYMSQLLLSLFDLKAHTEAGPVDVISLWDRIASDLTGNPPTPGALQPASNHHLMGGYDAAYYSYLWAKVYAQDMFSVFKNEGIFNPKTGGRYRREVLEPADSRDQETSLEKFLGRKPSPDAFFRELGVQ